MLYIGRYELYLKTRWNEQINLKNLWKVIKHPPRNCEFDMFISDNALNFLSIYALLQAEASYNLATSGKRKKNLNNI